MLLRIDTTSSVPVYAQIVDQITRAIATGALRAGDPLSSLRETAVAHRVNPLTVAKAYKQLEVYGLIETRHGLGSFVSRDIEAPSREYGRRALAKAIDDLLMDARQLGVGIDELRKLIDERIESAERGEPNER